MSELSKFRESAAEFEKLLRGGPMIRAVNFHNTPRARARDYEEQLKSLSHSFSSVNEVELDLYLSTGQWNKSKPGVIVAIYEGYRNGHDVFLPMLERNGLVGWFFVITGFVQAPPAEQLAFAASHDIDMATREYPDGRYAMTWSELREIDRRRHVVASHTRSHVSLAPLDESALEDEILGPQRDFEQQLGHPVRSFVSLGGPAYGEHAPTDRWIDRAGYQFVFSNMKIQRLREHGR